MQEMDAPLAVDVNTDEEKKQTVGKSSRTQLSDTTNRNYMQIKINDNSDTYPTEVLEQLPFFQTKFSQRWNHNSSKTANNNDQKHDKVDIGKDMPFSLNTFDTLINLLQTMTIPSDLPIHQLESLLECEIYFGVDIIDNDMIKRYFELSIDVAL